MAAGRNLNLYFTKHKTPSIVDHDDQQQQALNRSRSLPKSTSQNNNPNSLFNDHLHTKSTPIHALTRSLSTLSLEYSSDSEPDFATIYASQRFFVTSPGRSNSIIESTPSIYNNSSIIESTPSVSNNSISDQSMISSTSSSCNSPYVAVSTYSPDPYVDFRQSMHEMVEARDMHVIMDAKANWDYLHELLLCYLALNPKSTHKFIIGAFTDVLKSVVPPPAPAHGDGRRRGRCRAVM